MEKEVELVHKMNRELGAINAQISSVNDKIAENQELHSENREDIKEILKTSQDTRDKVAIQNGRVTSLEGTLIKLANVSSQNAGLIKTNQDNIKELGRVVNELEKAKDDDMQRIKSRRKAFLGISYSLLEKILWAVIILVATNISTVIDFIYNAIHK